MRIILLALLLAVTLGAHVHRFLTEIYEPVYTYTPEETRLIETIWAQQEQAFLPVNTEDWVFSDSVDWARLRRFR